MSEAKKRAHLHYPTGEYRFFLFDPEDNSMQFYPTVEARDEAAKQAIKGYLDECWHESVENVCVGEATGHAVAVNVVQSPKREEFDTEAEFEDAMSEFGDDEWAYKCNYEIRPLTDLGELKGGKQNG